MPSVLWSKRARSATCEARGARSQPSPVDNRRNAFAAGIGEPSSVTVGRRICNNFCNNYFGYFSRAIFLQRLRSSLPVPRMGSSGTCAGRAPSARSRSAATAARSGRCGFFAPEVLQTNRNNRRGLVLDDLLEPAVERQQEARPGKAPFQAAKITKWMNRGWAAWRNTQSK
jgi:hypothetical protein